MYKVNHKLLRDALRDLEKFAEVLVASIPVKDNPKETKRLIKRLKSVVKTINGLKEYHL